MNETKYFLHQIKRTDEVYDKGIAVKDSYESALQSYHAYLGAYAYGQNEKTDFVSVAISDTTGTILIAETWKKPVPQPEPEPEIEE